MYTLIRTMYKLHRLTAAQVWEKADMGDITEDQATLICGPRPDGND